jgi:tRNA (mo5U34)-methyltransferase
MFNLSARMGFRAARDAAYRPQDMEDSPAAHALWERVAAHEWYHSIELPYGVVTPGGFNHRPVLSNFGIPDDLDGMRVLDVGTLDGYWAFEFERRGAEEVIAIDIENWSDLELSKVVYDQFVESGLDRETGLCFDIAKEALSSKVKREVLNVYDLSPEKVGTFDIVFVGDLLLHLQNPILALERVHTVTKGYAIIADVFDPKIDKTGEKYLARCMGGWNYCVWWQPSRSCLTQMLKAAGFKRVKELSSFTLAKHGEEPVWRLVLKAHV